MIEKHYGRYIKSDSQEQLAKLFDRQPGTFAGTSRGGKRQPNRQVVKKLDEKDGRGEWI